MEKDNLVLNIMVIIFLAIMFFMVGHQLNYSYADDISRTAAYFAEAGEEGTLARRFALVVMFVTSLISLFLSEKKYFCINGVIGYFSLFFIFWSFISFTWAVDPMLTIKRLIVFGIMCLAALAICTFYSNNSNFSLVSVLIVTTLFLLFGIINEIAMGMFHPLSADYRFSGTLHPNNQAVNCSMMFLASMVLIKKYSKYRIYLYSLACVALISTALTKSRSAFISLIFAYFVLWLFNPGNLKKWAMVFSSIYLIGMLYVFYGNRFSESSIFWANLGRDESRFADMNGRLYIWERCLEYIEKRPILGYGFNGFWNQSNTEDISSVVGIGIVGAHSVYVEVLLGIGIVGLALFVIMMTMSIIKSLSRYLKKQDIFMGFYFSYFVFILSRGFMESSAIKMSSYSSFIMLLGVFTLAFIRDKNEECI